MKAKAAKMIFSKGRLDDLPVPAKGRRAYTYDTLTPSLCLCVTHKGTRIFYLYRRCAAGPVRHRIGRYPDVSIEQARREARELTGAIVKGVNPQDAKRAARGEATVGEAWEYYLTVHARPKKKARSVAEDEGLYRRFLAKWAGRKLSAIRKADVETLHSRVGKDTPYQSNRLLALAHTLFEHARSLGFEGPNPASGIERFSEVSRERFLQADELPAFFKALRDEPNTTYRDFFLTCLFTGARRGNVQSMRWTDLTLDRGTWTIPDTKSGKPQTVVLTAPAVAILQARQAQANGSPWVFPGRHEGRYLGEPGKAWARILARAGIENLRIHDLRRTFGSWAAAGGASLQIIGKALGHADVSTTVIYSRLSLGPVRVVVEAAVQAMLTAGNGSTKKMLPAPKKGKAVKATA